MPVITLTTDWGTTDYFTGALKGDILNANQNASIIDISNDIKKHDQVHGAFVLKNAWSRFPKGTVHLASINGSGEEPPSLVVIEHSGHFFLGPDDGLFSLVFDEIPTEMYYVKNAKGDKVTITSGILAASAAFLLKGGKIKDMGEKVIEIKRKSMLQASIEESVIKGSVIYIDSFGNLITNLTEELLERFSRGRSYEVVIRKNEYGIPRISKNYHEVGNGNLLALFNESGYLEIAICSGNASELLHMKYGDIVRIEFK